jgi:thioredoxin 1
MVLEISAMEDLNDIVSRNTFVVLDFFTPECPPCKLLSPVIEQLSKDFSQITFLKVNCNSDNTIARPFEIGAVPVLVYIKNGIVVGKTMGADQKEIIYTIQKQLL